MAEVGDLQPGECKTVAVGERELALFNVGGKFYATDNVCPHRGGPLGEGTLDGNVVTCPWHGWRFDVCTGPIAIDSRRRRSRSSSAWSKATT